MNIYNKDCLLSESPQFIISDNATQNSHGVYWQNIDIEIVLDTIYTGRTGAENVANICIFAGESAITPVVYQAEQITPPLAREGAINHINHILCPIELPTPSPNIRESAIKPTSSNHESSREGAIQNILPRKGGQKAHTLAGESAITPVLCQAEQITLPLAREGAINHINHKAEKVTARDQTKTVVKAKSNKTSVVKDNMYSEQHHCMYMK